MFGKVFFFIEKADTTSVQKQEVVEITKEKSEKNKSTEKKNSKKVFLTRMFTSSLPYIFIHDSQKLGESYLCNVCPPPLCT